MARENSDWGGPVWARTNDDTPPPTNPPAGTPPSDTPAQPVTRETTPYKYRAMVQPVSKDIDSIYETVDALKENVETLIGLRGDSSGHALLLGGTAAGEAGDFLTRTEHLAFLPPYKQNPHPQYWHMIHDPAWSEMYITEATGPFSQGDMILPWLEGDSSAYRIVKNAAAGTLQYPLDGGMYVVAVTLSISHTTSGAETTTFDIYRDGVPTDHDIQISTSTQVPINSASFTFLIPSEVGAGATYSIGVLETTDPVEVIDAQWTVFRYSSLPGSLRPQYPSPEEPSPGEVAPVSNFRVIESTINSQVISWSYATSSHGGFRLEQAVGAGADFVPIADLPPTARSYEATGLPPATLISYQIQAYIDATRESGWVQTGAETPGEDQTVPNPVTSLEVLGTTNTAITFGWNHDGAVTSHFQVQWREAGTVIFWNSQNISGSVRSHTTRDFDPGYTIDWRIRAVSSDGEQSAWEQIQASTDTDAPPIDPDAEYAPARVEFHITNPRPNNERGPGSRYSFTHSEVPYQVPICCVGGRPPFIFSISGIAGATILPQAPSFNPGMYSWAEVHIPAGVGGTYTVTVTDQDGQQRQVTVSVTADDNKFRFFSPSGSDSNSGSFGSPYQTLNMWYGSDPRGDSPAGKDNIMVLRQGTYDMPSATGSNRIGLHNGKPRGIIGFPGEVPTWRGGTSTRNGIGNNTSAISGTDRSLRDVFWANFECDARSQQGNWLDLNYHCHRQVYWKLNMHGIEYGQYTPANHDNVGYIIMLGAESHMYVSVVDTSLGHARNNSGRNVNKCAIEFYTTAYANVDGVTITDYRGADTVFSKSVNHTVTFTGIDMWDTNAPQRGAIDVSNARRTAYQPPDYPQNRTESTKGNQVRYCRFYATHREDNALNGQMREPPGTTTNFFDRCTLVGWMGRAIEKDTPRIYAILNDSYNFSNPAWGSFLIHEDVSVTGTTVVAHQNDALSHVDSQGVATDPDNRYKIGYLVPFLEASEFVDD